VCDTCGCSDAAGVRVVVPGREDQCYPHEHAHEPPHEHEHPAVHTHPHEPEPRPADQRTVAIEVDLLAKNDDLAARNRSWLAQQGMVGVNLMSSPGSGKTSLLERTVGEFRGHRSVCVIEGDQETVFDADRIRATGAPVVQINTGAGCHLDAEMLHRGLLALQPPAGSLLFVENVGNLVCPALFDLGESAKVVIISVTEGDDKPLKYPHMFAAADLVLVNKTDLLPYVDFDLERCRRDARSINPDVAMLAISVRTGDGMPAWLAWLDALAARG
jgi:hydrogenase nickel incorporation protein HypB